MRQLCVPDLEDRILDLFYPPHCPICGKTVLQPPGAESVRLICPDCLQHLVPVGENYCLKCGKPLLTAEEEFCPDCQRRRHFFTQNRALYSYQGKVRISLYRLKYANCREYARFYAAAMYAACRNWIRQKRISCIVPVPLHKSRMRSRGYNQSQLIAGRLGALMRIPVEPELLVRVRNTAVQKQLSGEERRKNLQYAFRAVCSIPPEERILLIDDIYTTGTTLDEAARALLQAGAGEVYGICAAIGG